MIFLKMIVVPAKEEEQEQGEKEKDKIVTATKKGAAVLDQFLSDQIKSEYHVLQIVSLVAVFIRIT
jgi:DNA-binding PadR family transcriptional regulator